MPALHLSAEGSWGAIRSSLAEGLSVLMAGTERGVVSCVSPHGERVAYLIVGGVGGVLATPDSQCQTLPK